MFIAGFGGGGHSGRGGPYYGIYSILLSLVHLIMLYDNKYKKIGEELKVTVVNRSLIISMCTNIIILCYNSLPCGTEC